VRNSNFIPLDAKRGDIGATAAAYAHAYLTPAAAGGSGDFEADRLTVNPLMGPDTLEPFVECANRFGKGLFVLRRTSNPGAGWLQDKMTGNRLISDRLADLIAGMGNMDTGPSHLKIIDSLSSAGSMASKRRLHTQ
jgi:orotidine-5'-phosphate decarboxylase